MSDRSRRPSHCLLLTSFCAWNRLWLFDSRINCAIGGGSFVGFCCRFRIAIDLPILVELTDIDLLALSSHAVVFLRSMLVHR